MNGVIVVNKPVGPSSFEMVKWVCRALKEKKAGHAGTLDPMASGVLVICLGEATKIIPYLMDTQKEYRATICLGVSTDTDDAAKEAKILFQADPGKVQSLPEQIISNVILSFVGKQMQRPPQFSALKLEGERLYDLARQVQSQEDQEQMEQLLHQKQREIWIDSIQIEKIYLPWVDVRICCGKGTYIRSFARDVGEKLGVGGHLSALQRIRVGHFSISQATDIKESSLLKEEMDSTIKNQNTQDTQEKEEWFAGERKPRYDFKNMAFLSPPSIFSMREALGHLMQIKVSQTIVTKLRQGQKQALDFLRQPDFLAKPPVLQSFIPDSAIPFSFSSALDPAPLQEKLLEIQPPLIAILDEENQLVALVEHQSDGWKVKRILNRSC